MLRPCVSSPTTVALLLFVLAMQVKYEQEKSNCEPSMRRVTQKGAKNWGGDVGVILHFAGEIVETPSTTRPTPT